LRRIFRMEQHKHQELEKEKKEIKMVADIDKAATAQEQEELNRHRLEAELQKEKMESMRRQKIVDQMRKEEADAQIEWLKKEFEDFRRKGKPEQQRLIERMKAVQNELLNSSWAVSRRKVESLLQ
uniref:TPH domain-containing protein n=1 Tax=Gongylonema pulchrum TaxID=637853 RepID=A0A183EJ81_9BILA